MAVINQIPDIVIIVLKVIISFTMGAIIGPSLPNNKITLGNFSFMINNVLNPCLFGSSMVASSNLTVLSKSWVTLVYVLVNAIVGWILGSLVGKILFPISGVNFTTKPAKSSEGSCEGCVRVLAKNIQGSPRVFVVYDGKPNTLYGGIDTENNYDQNSQMQTSEAGEKHSILEGNDNNENHESEVTTDEQAVQTLKSPNKKHLSNMGSTTVMVLSIGLQNNLILPLTLVQSLKDSQKWVDYDTCVAYIFICNVMCTILTYSWGYLTIAKGAAERNNATLISNAIERHIRLQNSRSVGTQTVSSAISEKNNIFLEDNENSISQKKPSLTLEEKNISADGHYDWRTNPELFVMTVSQMERMEKELNNAEGKDIDQSKGSKIWATVKPLINPSLIAVLLGLFIGCVPVLKNLFVGVNAPLGFLQQWWVIMGGASVPGSMFLLGANLASAGGVQTDAGPMVTVNTFDNMLDIQALAKERMRKKRQERLRFSFDGRPITDTTLQDRWRSFAENPSFIARVTPKSAEKRVDNVSVVFFSDDEGKRSVDNEKQQNQGYEGVQSLPKSRVSSILRRTNDSQNPSFIRRQVSSKSSELRTARSQLKNGTVVTVPPYRQPIRLRNNSIIPLEDGRIIQNGNELINATTGKPIMSQSFVQADVRQGGADDYFTTVQDGDSQVTCISGREADPPYAGSDTASLRDARRVTYVTRDLNSNESFTSIIPETSLPVQKNELISNNSMEYLTKSFIAQYKQLHAPGEDGGVIVMQSETKVASRWDIYKGLFGLGGTKATLIIATILLKMVLMPILFMIILVPIIQKGLISSISKPCYSNIVLILLIQVVMPSAMMTTVIYNLYGYMVMENAKVMFFQYVSLIISLILWLVLIVYYVTDYGDCAKMKPPTH